MAFRFLSIHEGSSGEGRRQTLFPHWAWIPQRSFLHVVPRSCIRQRALIHSTLLLKRTVQKMCGRISSGIPQPVSEMAIWYSLPPFKRLVLTLSFPPLVMASVAFINKATKTCWIPLASQKMKSSPSVNSAISSSSFISILCLISWMLLRIILRRLSSVHMPKSFFAKTSRFLTISPHRRVSSLMTVRYRMKDSFSSGDKTQSPCHLETEAGIRQDSG